jgi:hypothetical protein
VLLPVEFHGLADQFRSFAIDLPCVLLKVFIDRLGYIDCDCPHIYPLMYSLQLVNSCAFLDHLRLHGLEELDHLLQLALQLAVGDALSVLSALRSSHGFVRCCFTDYGQQRFYPEETFV